MAQLLQNASASCTVNPRVLSLRRGPAEYEQRAEAKFVAAARVTLATRKGQDVRRPRRFQEVVVPDEELEPVAVAMDDVVRAQGDDSDCEMSECASSQESGAGSYACSPASSVTSMELDAPANSYFGPVGENTTLAGVGNKRKFDACDHDEFVAAPAKRRVVAHPGVPAHIAQPVPAAPGHGFMSNHLGIYIASSRAGPFAPQRSSSFP